MLTMMKCKFGSHDPIIHLNIMYILRDFDSFSMSTNSHLSNVS